MRLKIGQSSISIERGDITDWEVDAIINAANSTLSMSTGVASTIKRKGGVIIGEEAMRQGPVEIGEAVLTTGGNSALPRRTRTSEIRAPPLTARLPDQATL